MSRLLDIPRFHQAHLNRRLMPGDVGDAFQKFVHQVLTFDYPELQPFPAGGKDGCIDLTRTTPTSRLVVECKYVGTDGLNEARSRWKSVAAKLSEHLPDPAGPTKYQSQYGPWYRTDPAIDEYIFCLSSVLANQEQLDEMQREIASFFVELGARHIHLAHLTNLSARVLDWNALCSRLQRHPHLIYRWFPLTRPQGLVPLEDSADRGTFRSYLSGEKLVYYGRGEHLKAVPAPPGISIPDEDDLLNRIGGDGVTGLIVTGSGGVGKTRLTLEIGRLAESEGWAVLRVQSRWREDALEQLAERLTPLNPVLLLIDYIETQRDFAELVEILNTLNDNYSLRLRYVANCRTSYYSTVEVISHHQRVDLSPMEQDAGQGWVESYQQQTVQHILERSGIEVTDEYLSICHGVPVLAVFVSYLHTTHRETELAELLREKDFSVWVAKRMALSLGEVDSSIARYLALFMALFPLPDGAVSRLGHDMYERLLDKLAADGWVEKLPADESHEVETWVTAHDVLADRILLSFLDSIRPTISRFLHDLFALARRAGCLRSALITLQRLADQPLLKSLDWPSLLDEEINQDPAAWREVRNILIRTPLLTPTQRVRQLDTHEDVWRGAEEETGFQNALGWLARWAIGEDVKAEGFDSSCRSILESWIQKAARWATQSNYVITSGILFCPEAVREAALNWILTRSNYFQTHYLLVAWLKQGLPLEDVASPVQHWATRFYNTSNFSFLIKAWLKAGGDKDVIREPLLAWLNVHGMDAAAQFVYNAWLKAGGDKDVIREPLLEWLDNYGADAEARFVYGAWLEAGGDKDVIREPLLEWLNAYGTSAEASFIYEVWLKAGGDKDVVREPLQSWLSNHGTDAEARFVYPAWLEAGGDKDIVREPLLGWLDNYGTDAEAGFVYPAWLEAGGDKDVIRESLLEWLSNHGADLIAGFVYPAWLEAGGDKDVIRESLLEWLSDHRADDKADFVFNAWLKAGGDKDVIREPLLEWLDNHGADAEARFVYHAWLKAGGDKDVVREPLQSWLSNHGTDAEAGFVYGAWLEAGGDKDVVREPLQSWLNNHGSSSGAQFVYSAWLEAGGDKDVVREPLLEWLDNYGTDAEARFVYHAWLEAGGDKDVIRESLLEWLSDHRADDKADFVFNAWLEAGGDKDVVRDFLPAWLDAHGTDAEADFIYKAWLEAEGEFSLIRAYAIEWLHQNYEREDAVFLTKFLAKQDDIPVDTVRDILKWCEKFSTNEDALWRLTQLRRKLLREELAEDVLSTSRAVLLPLFLPDALLTENTKGQITVLLAYLVRLSYLGSEQLRWEIDRLLLTWLRNPTSFGDDSNLPSGIRQMSYVRQVVALIDSGELSVSADRETVERFLRWVNNWRLEEKLRLRRIFEFLRREYPAQDLWDIVQFR